VGAKSDETIHMRVLAGPVTASAPFTLEKDSPGVCVREGEIMCECVRVCVCLDGLGIFHS